MSLKQYRRAIWRPNGKVAKGRDLALLTCASQRPRDIDPAITFLGTICNVPSVRRPVRLPVLTRTFGDLDRVASADLLKPDVGLSTTIGRVSNVAAIGRPRRPSLKALVESQPGKGALDRQFWLADMPFPVNKPSCTCQQNECTAHYEK